MKGDIVYKDLVQLDLDVSSTDELFAVMADKLERAGFVKPSFLEAIKAREAEYPTALPTEPYSVAIPHTNPECILRPFIACIRLKRPIPWREMADNDVIHQVRLAFMLGFQDGDGQNAHVELLQILVTNFQDTALMEKLMKAGTADEYLSLIKSMKGLEVA